MAEEMGFETLFEVLMREKNREELQRVEPAFYDEALGYIAREEDLVNPSNHVGFQRIRNLRSMLRELYSRREQKIIRLATMSSRGSDGQIDRAAMLDHERELFLEISQVLESTRKRRLDGRGTPPKQTAEPKSEKLSVTFIGTVGKFIGEELEPYGPFEEGDVAQLPEPLARILIEKGQAKRS